MKSFLNSALLLAALAVTSVLGAVREGRQVIDTSPTVQSCACKCAPISLPLVSGYSSLSMVESNRLTSISFSVQRLHRRFSLVV